VKIAPGATVTNEKQTMRLIPAATAAWIAVCCSRTHSGVLLDRDEQQRLRVGPGGEILFLYRRWPRPRAGPEVPATLLAWVM
jgi:hypothetical protein